MIHNVKKTCCSFNIAFFCGNALFTVHLVCSTAPTPVADFRAVFSNVTDTRGNYKLTWTPPTAANGSYSQQLEYSFTSAYTVGPTYNDSSNITLEQGRSEYVISNAFYFSNYTFIITTINLKYYITNGPVEIQNQSDPTGMGVLLYL